PNRSRVAKPSRSAGLHLRAGSRSAAAMVTKRNSRSRAPRFRRIRNVSRRGGRPGWGPMALEGNTGNIIGTERPPILLLSLGENEAAQVLKHMGAKDVQKLGQAMATMSNVTRDMAANVMDKFITTIEEETAIGVGADDYVRKVLVNALGEDKAS